MKTAKCLLLPAAVLLIAWGCGRSPEPPVEPVRRIERREVPPAERVITADELPDAGLPYEMPADEIEEIETEYDEVPDMPADIPVPPAPEPEEAPAPPPAPEPAPAQDPVAALEELGLAFNRWSFIEAAGDGNLEAVKLFLQAGVNPDVINSPRYGETALMWAARGGHADVARALIEGGAGVNIRNAKDMTALGYALMFKRAETAGVIRDAGGVR